MKKEKIYIYGKHVLKEALLSNSQSVKKIFLSKKAQDSEIINLIKKQKMTFSELKENEKGFVEGAGSHQGVVAQIDTNFLFLNYKNFIGNFKINDNSLFVFLAEVQDPHNVGAVIRSAVAFGASAIFMPTHKQAPITGAVVKVSSGMVFKIPIISIGNVNQAVEDLKKRGFWIYGLAGDGSNNILDENFEGPSVIILGNESFGIREKTREHCDKLLSIPIDPKCESLNAAVSAGVALFYWKSKKIR